jgi:prophage antirepressor-like protein
MTETNIVPFDFEGNAVRVIMRDTVPWWVLADVCHVLGIGNPADAARRLDDDEKGIDTIDTPGGPQSLTIVNESGLFSLILTSRKPEAKRFKKWVTAVVLPSIMRTGSYIPDFNSVVRVFGNELRDFITQTVELRLAQDHRVAVLEYLPALQLVIRFGGVTDPKGRRPLAVRVKNRLLRYCAARPHLGQPRPSQETEKWLFNIDAAREWFTSDEWRAILNAHRDKLTIAAGQSVLPFKIVKPSLVDTPANG